MTFSKPKMKTSKIKGGREPYKAGVYNQNKADKPDERATFYELKMTH